MPWKRSGSKNEIDNTDLLLHPAHLRRWIKALPLANMSETTRQFYELLQSRNQADLPPDLRLDHMAALHETAELILNHLHHQFITRTPPLPPKSQEILYLNQILLKNLAFSYKLAIRGLGQQEKIDTKRLALATHQAMDFMGRSYLLATQLYESEPAGLWHDIHTLYAFAERYELLDQPIFGLQPESTLTQTIRSTYLRTALLALCGPQTLKQGVATQLDECFRNYGNRVSLHREPPPPPNTGLFVTNLKLDRPPLRMLPGETPAMPGLRYFHMDKFLDFLRKAEQATPPIPHLPSSLAQLLCERYTHHSQRRFPRVSTPGSIPVTIGFTRIWQMIDNNPENISMIFPARGIEEAPVFLESGNNSLDFDPSQGDEWSLVNDDQEWRSSRSERLQTLSSPALVAPHPEPPEPWDIWQVLNASPGGFCLYWNGESPTTAQIGELIALQEYEGQNPIWRLGVIRWMHFAPDRGLEAGITLIATHFMIGELQSDARRSTDRQTSKVLFLPGMTGRNQPGSIIVPNGPFGPGQTVLTGSGHSLVQLNLKQIIEASQAFVRLTCTRAAIENPLPKDQSMPAKETVIDNFIAEKLIKILIIGSDPNEAESLVSAIISSGHAVHHNGTDNRGDIVAAITQDTPDLILASLDRIDLGLPDIIGLIEDSGKKIPVIALLDEPPADISGYLSEGAMDVVAVSNLAHLQLVVDRAARAQIQWNRMRQLETTILETEKRCQILLASAKDPIAYITDGMHVFANQTYLDLFGFIDQEDIAGTPLMDLAVREDQDHLKAFLRKFSRGKTKENVLKLKLRTESGKIFPAEIQFDPAIVDREAGIQIIIHHQTDTNELEKQLSYLSQRDLMTGLYNRQYFLDQLQEAIAQAAYGHSNSGVIHIVVDRFSEFKQTFGISGSDLILVDFGKLLEQILPEKDIACRFESNHFAVLTHSWQRKDLEKLMNALQSAFNDHIYELDGRSVNPTASMGASVIDENAPTPNEILNRAERAYKETLASAHGFAIYRPRQGEMTQKQLDEQWHQRLHEAIKQNRLRLLFQPIVSLRFDAGKQYNVFMRMLDEHGRPIAACEFMPSAERTGAAKMLDRWVIHEALEVLSRHAASKSHPLRLFVKLTAGSLQDPEILPWLTLQLQAAKVQGDCLVFEIKTSVAVNYLRQAREFQKGLRQLHSRLVLDDFGLAAKPFQLTRQIPAEFLKFDTSFMEDLPNNPENQETLKTMTTQAHAEGREVIAQRIEDPLSMSVLWGIGINYVQGNFLQVPSEHMNFKFDAMA